MAAIDPSKLYMISTTASGQRVVLASSAEDNTVIIEPETPDSEGFQQWEVTKSEFMGFYRLSTTQKIQDGRSLDVLYDNGTECQNPCFSAIGSYTGQLWRLDHSRDGTYMLSNNFTGRKRYLNCFSDALLPQLNPGDSPTQHWNFTGIVAEGLITSTSAPNAPTIGTSTPTPTNQSADSYGLEPEDGKLSPAGIAGVAIGGGVILALAFGVGFVVFIAYRRTKKKKVPQRPMPPRRERSYTAKWHGEDLPMPCYQATLGPDLTGGNTGPLPHHHDPEHPTE